MDKISLNAVRIVATGAICLGLAIIYFTGGLGLVLGILVILSAVIPLIISRLSRNSQYSNQIRFGLVILYLFSYAFGILKYQEHTTFIFSRSSKHAVGIIFGIPGALPLPKTHFWTKTIVMPKQGAIITCTKEEEMPRWLRFQLQNGEEIVGTDIDWNSNFEFPCIYNDKKVKAWIFSTPGASDTLLQKQMVELVNQIDQGKAQTLYSSPGSSIITVKNQSYIHLQSLGLAYLPDAIRNLHVNAVYLAGNKFNTIPSQLYNMQDLNSIVIAGNPIEKLPDNLYKIKKLNYLCVSDTKIRKIETDLSKLDSLENFDISRNHLTKFPNLIKTIPRLKDLSIQENELTNLFFIDHSFRKLQSLHVYTNRIKNIPENIKHLTSLKSLLIFDNKIDSIPERIVYLANLEKLEIWDNPIHYISPEIKKLTKLKELRLDDDFLSREQKAQLIKWLPNCTIHFQTRGTK